MITGPAKIRSNQNKSRHVLAVMLFAFSLTIMMSPAKAIGSAVTVVGDPADAGNWITNLAHQVSEISWLTGIFGTVSDLFTHITDVLTPVTKAAASATAAIPSARTKLWRVIMDQGTFNAQANGYNLQTAQSANNQKAATMPNKSAACGVNRVGQAAEQRGQRCYLGGSFCRSPATPVTGQNASCGGPGRASEQVNDYCQLGFITQTQYGSLKQNCPASQNPIYAGAPNLEDFLNNPMMPLAKRRAFCPTAISVSQGRRKALVQCTNSWSGASVNAQDPVPVNWPGSTLIKSAK